MRPRTFILVILIVVVLAVLAVLYFISRSTGSPGGSEAEQTTESPESEASESEQVPVEPLPTSTPALFLQDVVIARVDLPVGTRLTEELLLIEQRPNTNIALQGSYTFNNIEELVGQLIKVDIQKGDAILRPMIAIEASDLASFGSDLSLYVDRGTVAVAFPLYPFVEPDVLPIELLNIALGVVDSETGLGEILLRVAQEKGIAYSMRPGDLVDIMMTAEIVEIDPEFRTALPNTSERVIESQLSEGFLFFFPETSQGRLEFIPEINQVVQIVPSSLANPSLGGAPIPKRVTQLAIQQTKVLWVGTWFNREELEKQIAEAIIAAATGQAQTEGEEGDAEETQFYFEEVPSAPTRLNSRPDVVILSMPPQDAIALKWAIERGIDIDLALRAQGDVQNFDTASVSLFQIIEQGGVAVPPPVDFDLQPRPEGVTIPVIPSSVLEIGVSTTGAVALIEYREVFTGVDDAQQ